MDQNYRIVKSVEPSCTYQASSDMHEFYLIDDGRRALMTQYIRQVYDLCPWGLCDGLGYLQGGVFQEVDVETGACIFSWKSVDHVGPEESLVMPASTEISGTGESPELPWDYFHINSIDKSTFDGGYLVSARHTSSIYKIDRETGDIKWQIGGKKNQYKYDNAMGEVDFGYQHDVRWVSDSEDESVISVFDNASNGWAQTFPHSTGKIIRLNHKTKVASLVEVPLDPPWVDGHTHIAKSQGNLQLNLPGYRDTDIGGAQVGRELGNRLMGFGNDPFLAEYAWTVTDGGEGYWEKVFYGTVAYGYSMNYRAMKFDGWDGVPLTKPAIWSYSQYGMNHTADNQNAMMLYVSWNGHTKIDSFLFKGANTDHARKDPDSPDWVVLNAGIKKDGFETLYRHQQTFKYVQVEVFDERSVRLGISEIVETFFPNEFMRNYCDELACFFMDTNNPERERMRETMKAAYENYTAAKANGEDPEIEDVYESLAPQGGSHFGKKKVAGFAVSFTAIGLLIIGMAILALRRFITVQKFTNNIVSTLGMKVRRSNEVDKGKYRGLHDDETDIEERELDEHNSLVTRSTENSLAHDKQEHGLEAERQAFWRAHSP